MAAHFQNGDGDVTKVMGRRGKPCTKPCARCGKHNGIAKKVCSCGFQLKESQVSQQVPPQKKCPKCALEWPQQKRACTCGHLFFKKHKQILQTHTKLQKCSICGVPRKGHICGAKPVRTCADRALKESVESAKESVDEPPPSKKIRHKHVPRCGFCLIQKTIVKLMQLTEEKEPTLEKTLETLEATLDKHVVKLKQSIVKLKQSICKTQTTQQLTTRKNAFDIMRTAAKKKTAVCVWMCAGTTTGWVEHTSQKLYFQ